MQPFFIRDIFDSTRIGVAELLLEEARVRAKQMILRNHYTKSVPSGKSHYIGLDGAIVIWSIPANMNIGRFLMKESANVWELSRLWAPDGHAPNLLTRAISAAIKALKWLENPDALVSYADPSAGHAGGVYKAASWIFHGVSEEVRAYRNSDGTPVARRSFHSGKTGMRKAEIEALGFTECRMPGKL